MRPVYSRLIAMLRLDGALCAYSNDVYLLATLGYMSFVLAIDHVINKREGMRIDRGLKKAKLIFPRVTIRLPTSYQFISPATEPRTS